MHEEKQRAFADRLQMGERLHVSVDVLGDNVSEEALTRARVRNQSILALLSTMTVRHPEKAEDDSPFAEDMARLDAKLNLLMAVVGEMLLQNHPLPPLQSVHLNSVGVSIDGLAWLHDVDTPVMVTLHFDECLALPLHLPAVFAGEGHADTGSAFFAFDAIGDELTSAIERLVFRHHRRQLAEKRQSSTQSVM